MRNANEPGAADRFAVTINALLDDAMVGVVYLDRCGRIVEANTRARTILRHGDGLVERAGYLRAQVAADDARLRTLLSHMSGSGTPCTGSIAVQRSAKLPRLAVHLYPGNRRWAGDRRQARGGAGTDCRSGRASADRHRARSCHVGSDASREPGGGGVGKWRVGSRDRGSDKTQGELGALADQADPHKAENIAECRPGADGARRSLGHGAVAD